MGRKPACQLSRHERISSEEGAAESRATVWSSLIFQCCHWRPSPASCPSRWVPDEPVPSSGSITAEMGDIAPSPCAITRMIRVP
jgi:hypothetical protein